MITISVIIGSTREGRFSEKPARWILQYLRSVKELKRTCSTFVNFQCPSLISRCRPRFCCELRHRRLVG